jgi:phosphomannomutase
VIDSGQVELADLDEAKQAGTVEVIDPRPSYRDQIARMVDLEALRKAGLKVLHDPMYGAGAGYIVDLLAGGSTTAEQVRSERNPGFGGIHPEPIPKNLESTLALMSRGGYDLCICTDGDADRVGIIDETGRFINQLEVYALLMDYLLGTRGMKGPVVRTLTSTSMADRLAEIYGVECHEVQVGFKYVGPLMISTNAVMGGEESGGFGFRGHIPERDGILAGLYFADMIVRQKKPLSAILEAVFEKVGPHAYDRRDIKVPREGYDQLKRRIYERFSTAAPTQIAGRRVERIRSDDGFKFYLEDGSWALIRFSGTEPLIRVYSEAASQDEVEQLIEALSDILEVKK